MGYSLVLALALGWLAWLVGREADVQRIKIGKWMMIKFSTVAIKGTFFITLLHSLHDVCTKIEKLAKFLFGGFFHFCELCR